MREYKMGRGKYLDERVDDLEGLVEEYFGPVTGTEQYDGSELHVIESPDNAVFSRVTVGAVEYDSKKNTLALDIEERPAEEVIASGDVAAAEEAVDLKNDFLKEVTGRDAKARRESMKRDVEDEETPENV